MSYRVRQTAEQHGKRIARPRKSGDIAPEDANRTINAYSEEDPGMFPKIPDDLTGLSDEELVAALEQHKEIVKKVKASDPDVIGELDGDTVIASLTAGVADIERIRAEQAARKAGEEAFVSKVEELTAGIEDDDEEPEAGDSDEPAAEVVAEGEVEAVAEGDAAEVVAEAEAATAEAVEPAEAELVAATQTRLSIPRASKQHEPLAAEQGGRFALTASAGLEGVREGKPLDKLELAQAMIDKRRRMTAAPGRREEVIVASAKWEYPPERILDPRDSYEATQAKLDAVVGEEALVASGGLCAPVTPYYELMNVAVPDRPVRDGLPAFQAVRGGLQFAAPPVLGDVTTAITYLTEEEDAQGGTFATKSCQVVECPDFSQVDLAIVAHCVQFGNLGSRAFPEQVAQFNELVMAAHARVAETALLDGIAAASTAVAAATATYGYAGTGGLLAEVLVAGAGIRSRNRMARNAKLRAIFPEWIEPWLVSDLVNSQFDRFSRDVNGVAALLRDLGNIELVLTKDGATGASQVFGAQNAGALLTFPSTVVWYLFPEGSFLFLDGARLELGIVRDSVLNATNDFQIFGETFENVAFVGPEAMAVTSTICPAGSTGGPVATDDLLC